jgi:hypothetical protein
MYIDLGQLTSLAPGDPAESLANKGNSTSLGKTNETGGVVVKSKVTTSLL